MIQLTTEPNHRPPVADPLERASDDEPMIDIKASIGATLKTQLEKLSLQDDKSSGTSSTGQVCIK